MIIEAGYDLLELFAPKLFAKHGSKRRTNTWVIAMDENLRHLHLTKVGGDASSPIEERIPQIVKALNKSKLRPVVYYALAHLDTELHGDYEAEFDHLNEILELAPELIEYECLGTYLTNGKGFFSSGPRYSFRDYIGYEHLPRTATVLGPHERPCTCLACTHNTTKCSNETVKDTASPTPRNREFPSAGVPPKRAVVPLLHAYIPAPLPGHRDQRCCARPRRSSEALAERTTLPASSSSAPSLPGAKRWRRMPRSTSDWQALGQGSYPDAYGPGYLETLRADWLA
ncbi:MAG: hypothetical protein KF801_01690 [Cryobacterium sp.]|nr:hypothetical protein [Cryobacterium sp.]